MSATIRPATEDDLDAIAALHLHGNEDVGREEPLLATTESAQATIEFRDQVAMELDQAGHQHLAAERDGRCVGWGHGLQVVEPDGTHVGYVDAVYVARDARRTGIGTALLDATIAWLKEEGVERIQLTAVSRAASRALWLKRGFRPFTETLVLERPND